MAETKPFQVSYKMADEHGNLGPQTTTTVYATSQRDAKSLVQRKTDYKAVVTNVRKGGV